MKMIENDKLRACEIKLQEICDEKALDFSFLCNGYPIKLVIKPRVDMASQMDILENTDDDGTGYISADASITLYVRDGEMGERIKGTFDISDALKSKIKKLFKQMHYLYLQLFQRMMVEQKGAISIPRHSSMPEEAEPFEEYEQDEIE